MAKDKLDFNEIIKRKDGGVAAKDRPMPTEFFQCIALFSRPMFDELGEEFIERYNHMITLPDFFGKIIKRLNRSFLKEYFTTLDKIEKILISQRFVFPFYSKEIFMSREEAENFLPIFVKKLIKEEKLPENVVNKDMSVNEDIVRFGVYSLDITLLEQNRTEES